MASLKTLPRVIWMPGEAPACYSGTPVEMVQAMANEMAPGLTVRDAVAILTGALNGLPREIVVNIPVDIPEEDLAAVFVRKLLDRDVARPVVAAA